MPDYTLAIGPHDPQGFSARDDDAAVLSAIGLVRRDHADLLATRPEEVATLLGPGGLVTRAGERIDSFVQRDGRASRAELADTVQPGDLDAPDCNGG